MFMDWGNNEHPFEGVSVSLDLCMNVAKPIQVRQWVKTQYSSIWTAPDPQIVRPPLNSPVAQSSSSGSAASP